MNEANDKEEETIDLSLNAKFGKKNPYVVPYNYFESFEKEVIVLAKNRKESSKIFSIVRPLIAIAAVFCVFIGVYLIFTKNVNQVKTITNSELRDELSKIDKKELESYLLNNIDDVSEELLITNTNEKNINIYSADNKINTSDIEEVLKDYTSSDINDINL